jgi:peptidoglycan/xylan/chitin deacetylase (PgdA/CDA1 family)
VRRVLFIVLLVLGVARPAAAGMVTFTFDDGISGVYAHAFPVLKKLGLPAVSAVIVDKLESGNPDFMTPTQAKELQDAGWEIASHGLTHRKVVNVPVRYPQETLAGWTADPATPGLFHAYYTYAELAGVLEGEARLRAVETLAEAAAQPGTYYFDRVIREVHAHPLAPGLAAAESLRAISYEREVEASRDRLRKLGFDVTTYVVPYNFKTENVTALVQKYYSCLVTAYDGDAINEKAEPYHVFRTVVYAKDSAERFIKLVADRVQGKDTWLVLCLHDVGSGLGWEPWSAVELEKFATWLKTSGVPVVTIREGIRRMQLLHAKNRGATSWLDR